MKLFSISLLIAVLAAGCAATPQGFGSSSGGVPPRPAAASYPGWEHYCAWIDGNAGYDAAVTKLLSDAGKEGWELVTMVNIGDTPRFCFKRPLVDGTTPPAAPAAD